MFTFRTTLEERPMETWGGHETEKENSLHALDTNINLSVSVIQYILLLLLLLLFILLYYLYYERYNHTKELNHFVKGETKSLFGKNSYKFHHVVHP